MPDQMIGGGVVAAGDHALGKVLQGQFHPGWQQPHIAIGQRAELVLDRDRVLPVDIPCPDLMQDRSQHIDLER